MKPKKEKKKWGTIIFMVFIIIGLTSSFVFFGFSDGGGSQNARYNGFTFTNNGNVWITNINGIPAAFNFLPEDVEGIFAFEDFSNRLRNKFEIDVTYDSNSTHKEAIALAHYQMAMTLGAYNVYLRQGFTANNSFNLPVITCEDATQNVPVVYFKTGNISRIYAENDCIIAEASDNADFIKIKDRLLYTILGVMG